MRRLAYAAAFIVVTVTLAGCDADKPTTTAAPSPSGVAVSVATPHVTPASKAPTDPRGFTDNDIIKSVTVNKPGLYGGYGYDDNSPDFDLNASNGVGFKYWGCRKAPDDVFNNVVFTIGVGVNGSNGYLDGHDQMDRNPVENTTPTGSGYVHIWGSGPEGTAHYPVSVDSPGECNFRLDFVSIGSGGTANLGTKVLGQSGTGNHNVDTSELTAPWYLAWQYNCPSDDRFIVADSELGGGHIVQRSGASDKGVFEQNVSAGARTLSVVTGDNCQWQLDIYTK